MYGGDVNQIADVWNKAQGRCTVGTRAFVECLYRVLTPHPLPPLPRKRGEGLWGHHSVVSLVLVSSDTTMSCPYGYS
jgi:hypothetical protein